MADTILITPPAVEPVTLEQVRAYLRLDDDHTLEDDLLRILIASAREQAEKRTGRRFITQVRDMVLDAFPPDGEAIRLHSELVPAQEVVHLQYLDRNGTVHTVPAADYALDTVNLPGYVFPAVGVAWPQDVADSANAVRLRVRCGYGTSLAEVPEPYRLVRWMLAEVATSYRNREAWQAGVSVSELPQRYHDSYLDGYIVHRV